MNRSGRSDETIDFGFDKVPREEKVKRVGAVFDSVASRYDLMNDLMSLGIHRAWKQFTLQVCAVGAGQQVLDVAGGSGDLALEFSRSVGPDGHVILSDINAAMLEVGRDKLTDRGAVGNVDYALADAERLPFAEGSFDCVTIAFGLRNVTDKPAALTSMARVLKPGGRLVVLEFSHPTVPLLKPLYDIYSFAVLPTLGKLVAGDADSYQYLAESIRMHPDQKTLVGMLEEAGLERCEYFDLSGGIVAVHRGFKP
jgi:demethylmenaquinone methyltransferase/2-methoxy-6-polyprenyl-1,4-benzoquinol methylase